MKFSSNARAALFVAIAGLALGSVPATAQQRQNDKQNEAKDTDKPITDRDVSAKDVALTPLSDLNLKKSDIPPLLIAAQDDPYDLTGLARCPQIASAIGELDAVLGDDIDVAQAKGRSISAGRAAQEALGSFIPFRGVIREISGANSQQKKIQDAIFAGTARRGFLKGIGQARGCRYPARSATAAVIAQAQAEAEAAERAKHQPKPAKQSSRNRGDEVQAVSQPVVQPVPRPR
ncbi:MAG: hypothetical protein QM676_05095 [Novosphingobium sp.]